jgi:H+/gluconate symporter-like permease
VLVIGWRAALAAVTPEVCLPEVLTPAQAACVVAAATASATLALSTVADLFIKGYTVALSSPSGWLVTLGPMNLY